MSYLEACRIALEYFREYFGVTGLTTATEDDRKWFFSAGKDPSNMIGNTIISVSKESGKIEMVDFLSDDGFEMIKNSTQIKIPSEYISK